MAGDFEGYTHAQLHAMIASIDPAAVRTRGTQLTDAADAIRKIGDKLKKHKVTGWEGEAAEAFQEWVNKMGSATLVLADYSAAGGKQMTEAAQIMSEVKPDADGKGAMPPYSASREAALKSNLETSREYHNDPDAVQLGQEAWRKLNGDHARAVDAMNKLAGRYETSSSEMDKATLPTFPTLPKALVPVGVDSDNGVARPGGGSSGAVDGPASSGVAPGGAGDGYREPGSAPGRLPQADTTPPPATSHVLPPLSGVPDREVNVGLDHVQTLPNPTLPPTTGLPAGPTPVGPGPVGPVGPMPGLPVVGMARPGGGSPFGPFPTLTGPGSASGKLVGPLGLPPRETGITGGRPVTSTGPAQGLPRGTVIGAEGQQGLGRGLGGGMGHGVGGAHAGQAGSPMGRRLATESGGVVGGRQTGAAAGGRPVAGGQHFTQGGSGLVRNGSGGAGAGAMGHAGAGTRTPGQRREDQGGGRADYLAEDEETWQSNRRVVPPVID
ncbi:WXG100 family type VII secretion target [Streptomyces sp. cmx-4-9]|uniref:WXG100 family type VII secretion target n=1 Tax=Streptomyces sp. cmx-4-9 TaxID=2790941 RepID=UPI0039804348